jgi:hypothetical protein
MIKTHKTIIVAEDDCIIGCNACKLADIRCSEDNGKYLPEFLLDYKVSSQKIYSQLLLSQLKDHIILSNALYGCKSWVFSLGEEPKSKVYQKEPLPSCRKLHTKALFLVKIRKYSLE